MDVRAPWRLLSAGVVLVFLTTNIHCCPSLCQCKTLHNENIVDCSQQNLLSIPGNLPINTTDLDLSGNLIQKLTTQTETLVPVSGLSHLINLRKLSLSYNSITSIQGTVFQNLSMLHMLDLSYNKIVDIKDDIFAGLHNLTYLNFSGNNDITLTNNTFQDLTSLVHLDLSKTAITRENLWIPPSVQTLNLSRNGWDMFNMSIFEPLQDMMLLDLSGNILTDITFPPLHSLNYLDVSGNNIQKLSLNSFSAMPSLHTLLLDHNPISEVTGPVFQSMSQLQYLSLSQMPNLFYLDRSTLSGLQRLSTLHLSGNPLLEYIHISLFSHLANAKLINISYNNLSSLHPATFRVMKNVTIDIKGNNLPCDCSIEWITEQNNESNIHIMDVTDVGCYKNNKPILITELNLNDLHCGEISVGANTTKYETAIGGSVILHCDWTGNPPPLIKWITPRGHTLIYYGSHPLVWKSHPTEEDVQKSGPFHIDHTWHYSSSYQSDLIQYSDRIIVLNDGSLFIDYMLRSDTGTYMCIAENSQNKTSIDITLLIDPTIFVEIKLWSLLIGLTCATSFFMLNLIYALISALIRRCINQRRKDAILKLVENIDQYKSAQLSKLKDNYYSQLGRIRDGYHNQLERIRENYSSQAIRFKSGASQRKEWASQKVDTIRENYNSQVTRLKENSAQKLEQLRDTYNNQLLKIRDYGSAQMTRIHKKYKLQQRHVIKLLETMNFDNCRVIIDSECVRTESMIFETNLTHPDLNIPSPESDSDLEYHTASSNNETPISSQQDLTQTEAECFITSSPMVQEDSSHVIQNDTFYTMGDNSSESMGNNSNQFMGDNSSQSLKDNSDDDMDEMYDCNDIDEWLVQIQMIDESDDEDKEKSNDIESCV